MRFYYKYVFIELIFRVGELEVIVSAPDEFEAQYIFMFPWMVFPENTLDKSSARMLSLILFVACSRRPKAK